MDTDRQSELSLAGSILVDPRKLDNLAEHVEISASDFEDADLGAVWDAVYGMHNAGKAVDVSFVVRELRKRERQSCASWVGLLSEAIESVPNAAHALHYAQLVKQASQRRTLDLISTETRALAVSGDDPQVVAEGAIQRLEAIAAPSKKAVVDEKAWLASWQEAMDARYAGKTAATPTGFVELDKLLAGGLRDGEFFVIAARPGIGKTAVATALASNVSKSETPVLYFSLEMTHIEIADRLVSAESGVWLYGMRTGTLTNDERSRVVDTIGELSSRPLSIADDVYSIGQMLPLARQWARKVKTPGVVIVDYLQLIETEHKARESRQEVVSSISRRLKQLAKQIHAPVIALCQLNRQADVGEPRLSHLRESGAIEQDANQVLLLWDGGEDDAKSKTRTICANLAKNRNGEAGTFSLEMTKGTVRVSNPSGMLTREALDKISPDDPLNQYADDDNDEWQ